MIERMTMNINNQINISKKTTYDMFKSSNLYSGEKENRFFWIKNFCTIKGLPNKFKIGLSFRDNMILRMELFCADDDIKDENSRYNTSQVVLNKIKSDFDIGYKNMEISFDKRNNYVSIIISF